MAMPKLREVKPKSQRAKEQMADTCSICLSRGLGAPCRTQSIPQIPLPRRHSRLSTAAGNGNATSSDIILPSTADCCKADFCTDLLLCGLRCQSVDRKWGTRVSYP
ncbi:unnamed protein product [Symbiodinium natans]|uniref:Uncharacterized protein n=1 Tax=Symbiodinium natans TaxID=878477 RepID=A0A812NII1_9DINO|nr:unnamed protein product [Symbiodinium natans]